MIIVQVAWAGRHDAFHTAYIRDPIRRGTFVCGVHCNEVGVGVRTEGCTEDAELRIRRDAISYYQERVL